MQFHKLKQKNFVFIFYIFPFILFSKAQKQSDFEKPDHVVYQGGYFIDYELNTI
jgi:hypothetical protein